MTRNWYAGVNTTIIERFYIFKTEKEIQRASIAWMMDTGEGATVQDRFQTSNSGRSPV